MRASVLASTMLALSLLCGCQARLSDHEMRGAVAINRYGCGSCHTVKGINGANGLVGPPLTGVRSRMYLAGMLQNNPKNMAAWIRDPKAINPKTAMPNIGVTEQDSEDITAFLFAR